MIWLEVILNTPDDSDIGYFIEVHSKHPDNIYKKIQFAPENKIIDENKHNEYMKKIKPKNYRKIKNFICDWILICMYLIHYPAKSGILQSPSCVCLFVCLFVC